MTDARTATFVRKVEMRSDGDAALYRLEPPPAPGVQHVVVSAVPFVGNHPFSMFTREDGGPETYIFPADAEGEVTDWAEMDGSFRGAMDHERALRGLGYSLASLSGERQGVSR